jgi:hypothetical protein
MSLLDLAQIPGYLEARGKEQSNRDIAFLDFPVPLCGLTVRQFALEHLVVLGQCDNAFIIGAPPQPEDVALFLWVVSTGYRPGDDKARNRFVKGIANQVAFAPACRDITEYLDSAFMDSPSGTREGMQKSYTSFVAPIVDVFAHVYGWDDAAVMRKPIARLFQLVKLISRRADKRTVFFNPRSDPVISKWLAAQAADRN